jgi:UDP-N-acetylmuramoyl-L-alanyl-D-glutamate--2,6-diaminopimelate ligase
MLLSKLLKHIEVEKINGKVDVEVHSIQFDSRKVLQGSLFIATRGVNSDGHNYIESSLKSGAIAVICEEFPKELQENVSYVLVKNSSEAIGLIASSWYDFPSAKLTLVGITGTNGKTTTATLLYQLFRKLGYKTGLLSTVKNYINDEIVEATHTTPDAVSLNELLTKMVSAGCEYVFMEVSSHAVEQRRIAGLQFDGAVFTNLTRDHIDYHLTLENYLKAKKRFFDHLGKDAFALTNVDDKNGMVLLQNTKATKYTYSLRTIADFKTRILEDSFDGMVLNMNEKEVHVSFIGHFNAYNLTAVFATARLLGQDELEVLRILSLLQSVSGRFETIKSPTGFTVIVDYAHTPDALENVIKTINEISQGKGNLITVVGTGGNRDKGKRPIMAREAVNGSWKTIFTSDNPRDEEPEDILNDMLEGLNPTQKQQVITIVDRREAIKTACLIAQKDDIVLIAGKGHEDYQIIKGVKYHFDDKEEVRKIIND